jgi:hypothetical protein
MTEMFVEAGLLPKEKDNSPVWEELKYWFSQMTGDERDELLASGRWKVERRQSRGKGTLSDEPGEAES